MQNSSLSATAAFLAATCLAVTTLCPSATAQCGDRLIAISSLDDQLRTIDPLTGATLSSVTITGVAINRANGMARHPITGTVYVIVHPGQGAQARDLVTLDPNTAAATMVGSLGDRFSGLAFDPAGTLYGVTGDGAATPETLYTIDVNTAQPTLVTPLGNGDDGEVIAFDDRTGILYHGSGYDGCSTCAPEIFEAVDLGTTPPTITNIPLTGFDYTEATALSNLGGGNFMMADLNQELCLITAAGFVRRLATLSDPNLSPRGLVYVPEPNSAPFTRQYGFGCLTQSGSIPWLAGSGCPQPGQTVTLNLINGPPGAFGLLILGLSNAAAPLPSVSCQLQILPPAPGGVAAFTADMNGDFAWPLPLPMGLLVPFDAFFQVGLLDGSAAVVSNGLQVHIL